MAGVVESLTTLKAAGAKLSVCTNKLTRLSIPILERLDLARFFDSVIGADAAPAAKPDKRHLICAVEAAGGRIDHAIMVGDAATDAGAARAAGVPLVLVSFGYTEIPAADLGPDILIDHYDQLLEACVTLLTACGAPATGLYQTLGDGDYRVGFRAHQLELASGIAGRHAFSATVAVTEITGSESFVHLKRDGSNWASVTSPSAA